MTVAAAAENALWVGCCGYDPENWKFIRNFNLTGGYHPRAFRHLSAHRGWCGAAHAGGANGRVPWV